MRRALWDVQSYPSRFVDGKTAFIRVLEIVQLLHQVKAGDNGLALLQDNTMRANRASGSFLPK